MSHFKDYQKRRDALLETIDSLKDFEASDRSVGFVFTVAREILANPADFQGVAWLLRKGAELTAYFSYLEGTANVMDARYKVAEVAHTDVRNGVAIALRNDEVKYTEARALAAQGTVESEVDVIKQELLAKNYATAAKVAEKMVSYIQSTLRQKESERHNIKLGESGNH